MSFGPSKLGAPGQHHQQSAPTSPRAPTRPVASRLTARTDRDAVVSRAAAVEAALGGALTAAAHEAEVLAYKTALTRLLQHHLRNHYLATLGGGGGGGGRSTATSRLSSSGRSTRETTTSPAGKIGDVLEEGRSTADAAAAHRRAKELEAAERTKAAALAAAAEQRQARGDTTTAGGTTAPTVAHGWGAGAEGVGVDDADEDDAIKAQKTVDLELAALTAAERAEVAAEARAMAAEARRVRTEETAVRGQQRAAAAEIAALEQRNKELLAAVAQAQRLARSAGDSPALGDAPAVAGRAGPAAVPSLSAADREKAAALAAALGDVKAVTDRNTKLGFMSKMLCGAADDADVRESRARELGTQAKALLRAARRADGFTSDDNDDADGDSDSSVSSAHSDRGRVGVGQQMAHGAAAVSPAAGTHGGGSSGLLSVPSSSASPRLGGDGGPLRTIGDASAAAPAVSMSVPSSRVDSASAAKRDARRRAAEAATSSGATALAASPSMADSALLPVIGTPSSPPSTRPAAAAAAAAASAGSTSLAVMTEAEFAAFSSRSAAGAGVSAIPAHSLEELEPSRHQARRHTIAPSESPRERDLQNGPLATPGSQGGDGAVALHVDVDPAAAKKRAGENDDGDDGFSSLSSSSVLTDDDGGAALQLGAPGITRPGSRQPTPSPSARAGRALQSPSKAAAKSDAVTDFPSPKPKPTAPSAAKASKAKKPTGPLSPTTPKRGRATFVEEGPAEAAATTASKSTKAKGARSGPPSSAATAAKPRGTTAGGAVAAAGAGAAGGKGSGRKRTASSPGGNGGAEAIPTIRTTDASPPARATSNSRTNNSGGRPGNKAAASPQAKALPPSSDAFTLDTGNSSPAGAGLQTPGGRSDGGSGSGGGGKIGRSRSASHNGGGRTPRGGELEMATERGGGGGGRRRRASATRRRSATAYTTAERESDATSLETTLRELNRVLDMLKRAQSTAAEHRELMDLQALHGPQKAQQLFDAQKAQSSLQSNVKSAIGDLERSMASRSTATHRHRAGGGGGGFDGSMGDLGDAAPYPLSAAMKDLSPLDAERIAALIEQATANSVGTVETVTTARETINQRKQRVLNLRRKLREQIQALQMKTATAAGGIDRSRDERNALVRQYVLWRRRREFDEDAVAPTFEQELEIGPRTRDVETQCVVQSETLPMQILKLVRIMDEEDTLKDSLKIIKSIVRDMDEINRFMRVEITCPVCRQLFRNCVVMWPCGHSFCAGCFEGLQQAPGMFRCAVCSMTSADGCTPCCTVDEVVGRWLFKKSGFSEVVSSADEVQAQLAVFSKGEVQKMLRALSAVSQHL